MSEMPHEMEEEEEMDEETSIDGLDDVEKSLMKIMVAPLSWRKTKSERHWRRRGNKNVKKFLKRDHVHGSESRQNQRRLP